MIIIKNSKEIDLMREGGKIGASVLRELLRMIKPGLVTSKLETKAEELLYKYKAKPAFKNYSPDSNDKKYPAALCISVNEELVHGIPSDRKLIDGDIISLDLGVDYKGYYTDMAQTIGVGNLIDQDKKLISVTQKSLNEIIKIAKAGVRLGDLGALIQKIIEENYFSVIRDCVGHGIGRQIHEEPSIPNFGQEGTGIILKEGMTLAIEPMAAAGKPEVIIRDDGWTIATSDNSRSAHFEETIAIEKDGCRLLTVP